MFWSNPPSFFSDKDREGESWDGELIHGTWIEYAWVTDHVLTDIMAWVLTCSQQCVGVMKSEGWQSCLSYHNSLDSIKWYQSWPQNVSSWTSTWVGTQICTIMTYALTWWQYLMWPGFQNQEIFKLQGTYQHSSGGMCKLLKCYLAK